MINIKIDGNAVVGGILGIGAVGLIGWVTHLLVKESKEEKAEREKFEKYRAEFCNERDICTMIDEASLENDFLTPDERSNAKLILEDMHRDLLFAKTIPQLKEFKDKLETVCNNFLLGSPEDAKAHVGYLWKQRVEKITAEDRAAQRAFEERKSWNELYYEQQRIDSIANAVTNSVKAIAGK